jgi:hypothetical protein
LETVWGVLCGFTDLEEKRGGDEKGVWEDDTTSTHMWENAILLLIGVRRERCDGWSETR